MEPNGSRMLESIPMAEYKAKRNPDRCRSRPGAILDDIMPSLSKPKA